MENKKFTVAQDDLVKNINIQIMNLLDRNLVSNYSLEKTVGIRNFWWSSGIKTGLCLGVALFSPKYRLLMTPFVIYHLVKDIISIMDLNSEEAKLSKKFIENFVKHNQTEQKPIVTPGNGTIN